MRKPGSGYHPVLILLHWLTALLLAVTFGLGAWVLVRMPNTPAKVVPLEVHMALGLALLVVTAVRFVVRLRTVPRPRLHRLPGPDRRPLLSRLARPVQYLLYLFTFLMTVCGLGLALQAGLPGVVFAAAPLPEDFFAFPLRDVHALLSVILLGLVVLHLLVWVQHQFLRGENALAWMWFPPRRVQSEAENNKKGRKDG
jgi:cytochrome b561